MSDSGLKTQEVQSERERRNHSEQSTHSQLTGLIRRQGHTTWIGTFSSVAADRKTADLRKNTEALNRLTAVGDSEEV